MEVPFISSGAISRAHNALVRKVETAASVPAADQVLLAEIEVIREHLSRALSEVSALLRVTLGLLTCPRRSKPRSATPIS